MEEEKGIKRYKSVAIRIPVYNLLNQIRKENCETYTSLIKRLLDLYLQEKQKFKTNNQNNQINNQKN